MKSTGNVREKMMHSVPDPIHWMFWTLDHWPLIAAVVVFAVVAIAAWRKR